MAIDLTGRPILITGASSGIGRAAALACARAGMPVFATARRRDKLEELVEEIRRSGGRAAAFALDVMQPEGAHEAVAACVGTFGAVYAIFANAGFGIEKAVHLMSDAEIRTMFDTNFYGSLNIIRPALPHMIEARSGHVLMCASALSRMAIPYFSVYSATKAAQHHISRAMGLELERYGVRVSSVHPVSTRTEFFRTVEEVSGAPGYKMIQHSPDLFIQPPEKVASAIVRCLRRPRPEVWTSQLTRWGMTIGELFPRVADLYLRRMVRERERKDGEAPRINT